jgi:hypothetical protein
MAACTNAYDAEKIAERYCDCMRDNGSPNNFEKASVICGDKLTAENRYIKLWAVDMNDRELDKKVLNATRDSVKLFIDGFISYTNTHCCKETLACPDSTDSLPRQ